MDRDTSIQNNTIGDVIDTTIPAWYDSVKPRHAGAHGTGGLMRYVVLTDGFGLPWQAVAEEDSLADALAAAEPGEIVVDTKRRKVVK